MSFLDKSDNCIYSMTGFGKHQITKDNIQVTVEIKTVNHRFKDLRFKMSSHLSSCELDLRNLINDSFKRGSFDISINYKKVDSATKFDELDELKVKAFIEKIKSISGEEVSIRPTEFLRPEFYKEQDDSFAEDLKIIALEAMPFAIENLKESRKVEGEKLVTVLNTYRENYESHYNEILKHSGTFQAQVKEKLKKKFDEFQKDMPVDEPRFMQEVIFYLEKMDINEELNRVEIHLEKFDEIINTGGEVGRKLDFLLQELNRETNTTGSKSSMQEISQLVVEMKMNLEKIREQALNLE